MFNTQPFDDLARRLADSVPAGLTGVRQEFERNMRTLVQSTLAKMELVTREEFDVQKAVLARTRSKLEALEQQVLVLEERYSKKLAE